MHMLMYCILLCSESSIRVSYIQLSISVSAYKHPSLLCMNGLIPMRNSSPESGLAQLTRTLSTCYSYNYTKFTDNFILYCMALKRTPLYQNTAECILQIQKTRFQFLRNH